MSDCSTRHLVDTCPYTTIRTSSSTVDFTSIFLASDDVFRCPRRRRIPSTGELSGFVSWNSNEFEINREGKRTTYTRCRLARHWSYTDYLLRGFAAVSGTPSGGSDRKWNVGKLTNQGLEGKIHDGETLGKKSAISNPPFV